MDTAFFNQFVVMGIHFVAIAFLLLRISRARTPRKRQILIKVLIIFLLLIVTSYNISQARAHQPMSWWVYTFGNVAMLSSGVLGYFLIEQTHDDQLIRSARDIATHRATLVTAVFAIFMMFVDFSRRHHLVSIWAIDTFERSWIHALSFVLFSTGCAYVGVLAIRLQRHNYSTYTESLHRCRTSIVALGYLIGIAICVVGMLNTVISVVFDNPYRITVYSITQQFGVPLVFFLLALGCIPPFSFYRKLIWPIEYIHLRQQRRQQLFMNYLHRTMIEIAPIVHLNYTHLDDRDKLIEIIDAREVILSWVPNGDSITPDEEARILFRFLGSQQVISTAGTYLHPPMADDRIIKHSIAVAQKLIGFQKMRHSDFETTEV